MWPRHMAASTVVGPDRPLHLEGTTLYLDRLWADECLVAAELGERSAGPAPRVDADAAPQTAWESCSARTMTRTNGWPPRRPCCAGCR